MRKCLLLLCCFVSFWVRSSETPIPAKPDGWVTDKAEFLSKKAVQSLNFRLEAYEKETGRQVFVYIGKSTGEVPIEDWSVKAFQKWKVGQKGKDDGVLLVLMKEDKRIRIEVGYGLEGQLTDAFTARIINDVIKPKIDSGDNDGAVIGGAEAIVNVLDGKKLPDLTSGNSPPVQARNQPLSVGQILLYSIAGIILLFMLVTHPSFTIYLLLNILSGGRGGSGGGGSGSSGGFGGGGGGRSGGGGASGSW